MLGVMGMLYNKNKKGTIIVSHYRSGGTQLLQQLWLTIGEENTTMFSEWKHDTENYGNPTPYKDLYELLDTADKYALLLINYPIDISNFFQNGVFDKLKDDYQIIILERKNKTNCLLSLTLWEEFIKAELNINPNDWTDENMNNFHQERLDNLVGTKGITLGYTNQTSHLNGLLKDFVSDIHLLHKIQDEFKFPIIYYEDFEYDSEYLVSWYSSTIEREKIIKSYNLTQKKIPYVSKDYLVYYTENVKKALKGWRINEL